MNLRSKSNGFTMVGPLVASELVLLYCHRSFIKN